MEMKLDLTKGMTLDLTKDGSKKFKLGLSWNPADVGEDVDVDASAFLLNKIASTHMLTDIHNVVYFKEGFKISKDGSTELPFDSRDGKSDGFDEIITIDTTKITSDITQINLYINIFKPAITFRQVKDATVTILDENEKILATFNASADLVDENCLLAGTITRNGTNWDFTARGEGYIITDLNTIVQSLSTEGSN